MNRPNNGVHFKLISFFDYFKIKSNSGITDLYISEEVSGCLFQKKGGNRMNELQLVQQMEITGGGAGTLILCIVIGAAVYKMLFSNGGRVSIPKLISIEWR